jgi:hypothetical protein
MKQFAQIFAQFYTVSKINSLHADQIIHFFDASDAWRKTDRLRKIFVVAKGIGVTTSSWERYLDLALAVDAGLIARNILDGNGVKIQEEISRARLQAVSVAL